jgi:branched-chain amino acid aminotransferase
MGKFICFNGRFEKASSFHLSIENRAFRYGDGFFETMHYAFGEVQVFAIHHKRILRAMQLLQLSSSLLENSNSLLREITHLINANHQFKGARIRITIYRSGAGLYQPETNTASYLIESDTLENDFYPLNINGLSIACFDKLTKPIDNFQFYKSLNTTVSVLASLYAKEITVDDCLLMNTDGFLIESISSNVFFLQGETLYTPDIESGCVEGVMREKVIETALDLRYSVIEGAQVRPEHLLKFDEIFLTNAIHGIRWVVAYKNKRYYNKITQKIQQELVKKLLPSRS